MYVFFFEFDFQTEDSYTKFYTYSKEDTLIMKSTFPTKKNYEMSITISK